MIGNGKVNNRERQEEMVVDTFRISNFVNATGSSSGDATASEPLLPFIFCPLTEWKIGAVSLACAICRATLSLRELCDRQ
ncbi:unnamed protein product [Litomosoides sigmodontis]|uniref:Uncharacterized protein n=1 Tax=Litomosoides sigmodontis TaxID=42156 RepID=A0A3P6U9L6_LITSI|nr:unnamed protein product [Litomosoides sigmodontis]